jgi:hypothetical protein
MYKIENKSIELHQAGYTHKTKNRILDNYLDYIIYCMLPPSVGSAVFPKFADFGYAYLPLEMAFLKFNTPQTITDTDTTMLYDDYSTLPPPSDIKEVIDGNKKLLSTLYLFSLLSQTNGDTFQGLGFGRDDYIVTDFLLSYIDLSVTQQVFNDSYGYAVSRYDEISTDETIITGDAGYLPGYRYGTLESISMCYALNGADPAREYHYSELDFTYVSAGNVSVTGFDDFYIEDEVIYPKTDLYPFDGYLYYSMATNGYFIDGITGWNWNATYSSMTVSNSVATITTRYTAYPVYQAKAITSGHKYYFRGTVKPLTNTFGRFGFYNAAAPASGQYLSLQSLLTLNVATTVSGILTANNNYDRLALMSVPNGTSNYIFEVSNFDVLDLTDIYGAGNEPSQATMDTLFTNPPYFYPSQAGEKIQSVKFRYKGNDDSATKYETYINIEDLGVDYNNTDVSINLICERG